MDLKRFYTNKMYRLYRKINISSHCGSNADMFSLFYSSTKILRKWNPLQFPLWDYHIDNHKEWLPHWSWGNSCPIDQEAILMSTYNIVSGGRHCSQFVQYGLSIIMVVITNVHHYNIQQTKEKSVTELLTNESNIFNFMDTLWVKF